MLDADQGAKALAHAKGHLDEVIKLQAFARGCRDRQKYGSVGKKKNGKRKKGSDKMVSEVEQKMLSARSG